MNGFNEPWQFDEENHGIDSDLGWGLLDECSSPIGVSVCSYRRYGRLSPQDQRERAIAKAKRIVQCVNACAGVEKPPAVKRQTALLAEALRWERRWRALRYELNTEQAAGGLVISMGLPDILSLMTEISRKIK